MEALTNEELCVLAQQGDQQAREELIKKNIRFVQKVASSKATHPANKLRFSACGITADDLRQAGSFGLMNAIDSFAPSSGYAFITYAAQAISHSMSDMIAEYSRDFKYRSDTDPSSSLKEVSGNSLRSGPHISNDSELSLSYFLPPSSYRVPEDVVIRKETRREIRKAINALSDREKVYLLFRFGFEDEYHTLTKTALFFHLSESRARSLERAAFDKIRNELFVVQPEKALARAEDALTKQLVAEGELHAVELRLRSEKKRGKKITAAVYRYLADYDGYWGELQFTLADHSMEILKLAEWDTTVSHRFVMRALNHFQEVKSMPPKKLVLTFVVPEDYWT